MSDFGEFAHRKNGRKDHRCEWCGETIRKGQPFAHYTGKWQGEFQNWRMHEECYEVYTKDPDIAQDGFMPFENERPSAGLERSE